MANDLAYYGAMAISKFWRAHWRFLALFVCAFVFAGATSRFLAEAQNQDQGVIRVGVNLVLVDATVKTKAGQIMADLKKENFEVREDGVEQKLEVFSRDELPLEVALFTFSTEAQLRVPFTKDKREIANQINAFHAGGATNINDGIFIASENLLKTPPKGRRVIILISDDVGTDAGGQGTRDIVTEAIAAD